MLFKQNLHTHTTFCDGVNSAEDVIIHAKNIGFDSIGFSGHSHSTFSPVYTMTEENTLLYNQEIKRLKEKYKGQFEIYHGLEFDYFSDCDLSEYDYLIGSVHALKKDGEFIAFDRSAEVVKNIIDKYFDGDGKKYAREYYRTLAALPTKGRFDIVGHFDLITKHSETHNFFDINDKDYQNWALEAVHALKEKIEIFEINTGAITRGYRTTPYPHPFILKELKAVGAKITISSDCHDMNFLDYRFDQAVEYAKAYGFNEIFVLKDGVFQPVKI